MAWPEAFADALAGVSIFAGVDSARLAELAASAERVSVRAGSFVFRQGDEPDALFVLLSGRVEAIAGTPPRVLRVLGRGDAIGELALLTGSPRSASVRARRDSELLRLDAGAVARLLADEPTFATALTRSLAAQLQASQGLDVQPSPIPETVAVVALPGAPTAAELATELSALMGGTAPAPLTAADAGDPDDYPGVLDRAERSHVQVLLAAEPDDGPWRQFCLRQADRTLLLAAGHPGRGVTAPEREGPVDVLLAGVAARGSLGAWLDALGAHRGRLLGPRQQWPRSLPPLARALTGRSTALVCSGGGARGFAHIGVLEVLEDAGVVVDRLSGVSMGAVVAAQRATGAEPGTIRDRLAAEFVDGNPLGDYTLPLVALVRGRNAEAMVDRLFGDVLIEELPTEYTCASCDLVSSELLVHRRGRLAEAVCASFCLPGIGPPVVMGERLLVDGGVMDNLPVEAAAEGGEGPVIASDVTAVFALPARRVRGGGLADRLRSAVLGRGARSPLRLPEVIIRSITVGSRDTVEAGQRHADVVIRPETGRVGLLDFGQIDRVIEAGREAARATLEKRPDLTA